MTGQPPPVLDIEGCVHERGGGSDRFHLLLETFRLAAGERIALVGPSGCGKSTALDLLSLVLRPLGGARFRLAAGEGGVADVLDLWRRDAVDRLTALRARGIGYVLQTGGLVPFLPVRENVLLTRRLLGLSGPGASDSLLEALGLGGLGRRLPRHLSVGQRQRVAMVRALAHDPALILADEPTAALDPETAETTMEELVNAAGRQGAALVVVTHDWDLAERAGLRVVPCERAPHGSVIRYAGAAS